MNIVEQAERIAKEYEQHHPDSPLLPLDTYLARMFQEVLEDERYDIGYFGTSQSSRKKRILADAQKRLRSFDKQVKKIVEATKNTLDTSSVHLACRVPNIVFKSQGYPLFMKGDPQSTAELLSDLVLPQEAQKLADYLSKPREESSYRNVAMYSQFEGIEFIANYERGFLRPNLQVRMRASQDAVYGIYHSTLPSLKAKH